MRIPEVQAKLREIALRFNGSVLGLELEDLADALSRRPQKRGPRTCAPVTDEIRRRVWQLHNNTNYNYSQQAIADMCNIASGRVSEILHGKRV